MLPKLLGAGLKGMGSAGSSIGGVIQKSVSGGAKALGAMALSQTEPEVLAAMYGGKKLLGRLKKNPPVAPPMIDEPDAIEPISSSSDTNLEKAINDMGESIVERLSKLETELGDHLFSINFSVDVLGTTLEEISQTTSRILGKMPDIEDKREAKRAQRADRQRKLTRRDGTVGTSNESGGSGILGGIIGTAILPFVPIILKVVGIVIAALIGLGIQIGLIVALFKKYNEEIQAFIDFFKNFPYKKLFDDLLGRSGRNPTAARPGPTVSELNPDGTRRTQRQMDEAQLISDEQTELEDGELAFSLAAARSKRTFEILENGGTMEDVTTERIKEMKDLYGTRRKYDPTKPLFPVPQFRKKDPTKLFETPVRLTPENVKPSDLTPETPTERELTPEQVTEKSEKAAEVLNDILSGESGFMGGGSSSKSVAQVSNTTNIFNPIEPRSPVRDIIAGFPTGIGLA